MNFCINKTTLEVIENDYAWSSGSDWEIYPYTEYEPETHDIVCNNFMDVDSGTLIDQAIHPSKTIQEITDDLKAIETKYASRLMEFDYISFIVETRDELGDPYTFIVPKGVYRPTKERALAWYQEKLKKESFKIESRKKNLLMQLENNKKSIESITKQLEELNGEGE